MNHPAIPADCRLVVFDLDGTLYDQGPVRRAMLLELLTARGRPRAPTRVRIVRRFRILREEMSLRAPAAFDAQLFARLSAETGWTETALRALIREWIDYRPLRHLAPAMVPGASDLFSALRKRGIMIAVWSDYAVPDKLAALDLAADHVCSAEDPDIAALKPDPAGLASLLERTGTAPSQALMIGDRMSRDGTAAAALGVPFMIRGSGKAPSGTVRIADFRPLARALQLS